MNFYPEWRFGISSYKVRDDAQKDSGSRPHKQIIMKLLILMVNMLEWFSGENDVQFGKFS